MVTNVLPQELIDRFPDYTSQISQLLKNNDDFREIVDDYRFCLKKLGGLTTDPGDVNPLIHHYENAVKDLENDMMEYFVADN
jgi:hypothetical protein